MKNSMSPTQLSLKRFRKNRLALLAFFWLLFVIFTAVCAQKISQWTDHPPELQLAEHKNLPPSWWAYSETQKKQSFIDPMDIEDFPELYAHNHSSYWFGTDSLGRDLFVRVLSGAQVSLKVAFIGTLVSLIIGISWGALAGYIGGWLDEIMMRFVDILYALPYIFFVILIMTIFGHLEKEDSFFSQEVLMFMSIGAISWLTMARLVRGEVLSLKERDYVAAVLALGAGRTRILVKHVVPNILGLIIVYSTLMVPQFILTETFLSFLGLGIQAPKASWGNLIKEGATLGALEHYTWLLIFPGLTLASTLLALNLLGDGLRDAFDPRAHR
jgi:oligopeptide transport system permease protein